MRCVLGIDAGTTGVRAIAYSAEGGHVAGSAYRELRMSYPRPGWVEQDAELLWEQTADVIRAALELAGSRPADVAAVGITNQRASAVAWDSETLSPLAPMIVWQDTRTEERCRALGEEGKFVTPNMSVTKFEWIARNVPDARDALQKGRLHVGTPDSFLCAKLTGGLHVTDHSNACTTGLYAHFYGRWDSDLLAHLELDPGILPNIVDTSGHVGETAEAVFGASVPVAALCGDQQSSLYGLACRAPGLTKCSFGTAAMVDANTGDSLMAGGPGTYPLVAWCIDGVPTYCVEGTVITAGAAVQWLRDGLGVISDAAQTASLAATVEDSGGVWVVPAFQGLGTPFAAAETRAMIGGLSRGTTRAHVVRAFLESIAQRVCDAAESVWEACGTPDALRVDGGASANNVLLQMQANVLGVPVERSSTRDGAALGAAALAGRAMGVWDGEEGALEWRPERVFQPQLDAAAREERRVNWKRRLARCVSERD